MAVTYVGKVSVQGVSGTVAFTGVLVGENMLTDSVTVTDSFTVVKLKNGEGKTKGCAATDRKYDATFGIIPYSTTIGAARALVKLPGMLGAVTIAGVGPCVNGRWSYVGGGTVAATQTGYVKITLPCRRAGGTPAVPTLPPQS